MPVAPYDELNCLNCTLPICNESDPGCLYQIAKPRRTVAAASDAEEPTPQPSRWKSVEHREHSLAYYYANREKVLEKKRKKHAAKKRDGRRKSIITKPLNRTAKMWAKAEERRLF